MPAVVLTLLYSSVGERECVVSLTKRRKIVRLIFPGETSQLCAHQMMMILTCGSSYRSPFVSVIDNICEGRFFLHRIIINILLCVYVKITFLYVMHFNPSRWSYIGMKPSPCLSTSNPRPCPSSTAIRPALSLRTWPTFLEDFLE